MKSSLIKNLFVTLIVILMGLKSFPQIVPDRMYYERLYYMCKVWGHAKYYHAQIALGNIDWDEELMAAIPDVKEASTNEAFNIVMQKMLDNAGDMLISHTDLPMVPDSLNNNANIDWIYNKIFNETISSKLDTILVRFRPRKNKYVGKAGAMNPTYNRDTAYHSQSGKLTEELRLLSLFRYWNIVHYFFPYKTIMDQDWDTTLKEFIPKISQSEDDLEYSLNFRELTTRINDSHGGFYNPTFQDWRGACYPPFEVRTIEQEMVITKVLDSITEVKPGDIIKEINGFKTRYLKDSLIIYAEGSNDVQVDHKLNRLIIRGPEGKFNLLIEDGENTEIRTLERNYSNRLELDHQHSGPVWRDTLVGDSLHYGIVDMKQLETSDIENMFTDLWNTDAIIFDIRNYPNGTLWELVNYLFNDPIHISNITVPDYRYPGRLYWSYATIGTGTANPYAGNIMLLFDERTQSHAEYTCMGLDQFPNAIKIGSRTSGADGNVSWIYLPGQMITLMTGLGVYYPDYTQTQRVGIIPDYVVHPTIQGIRNGVDEVLEFALNLSMNSIVEIKKTPDLQLYPNPVSQYLNYVLPEDDFENRFLIEVIDIYGRTVKKAQREMIQGQIDFSSLTKGTYFVRFTNRENILITKVVVKQ